MILFASIAVRGRCNSPDTVSVAVVSGDTQENEDDGIVTLAGQVMQGGGPLAAEDDYSSGMINLMKEAVAAIPRRDSRGLFSCTR